MEEMPTGFICVASGTSVKYERPSSGQLIMQQEMETTETTETRGEGNVL